VLQETCLLQLLQHCSRQVAAELCCTLLGTGVEQQPLQALADLVVYKRVWVPLQGTDA
jgi:hypothetical protein